MKNGTRTKILAGIEKGYDQMAEKFSGTRCFFWPDLNFIKDEVTSGSRVLDFGCGNGRLLNILKEKNIQYFGVDVSQKLVNLAKEKYPQFSGNITKNSGEAKLDFPNGFFDAVISVAVFHHLPDKNFRLETAKELYRLTAPGGRIIITTWNLWQKKYRRYIWKNIVRKIFFQGKLDFFDCEIPFKNNAGESFLRFHHAYTLRELNSLFKEAGFSEIETKIVNGKNLVLIGKK